MVEVESRTRREDGVTLVAAVVRNGTDVRRRVRLENALDGPTLPPRRHGVPADGWDGDAVTVTLEPGEREGVGFASHTAPESPAIRVVEDVRVTPEGVGNGVDSDPTPDDAAALVRRLGDPAPPRDAVPAANAPSAERDRDGPEPDVPPPVAEWFATVESRVRTVEACAGAETLAEATAVVDDAGGLGAVERAVEEAADDAATLRAVERRAAALADRAEGSAEATDLAPLRTLS
ncbi:DUF7857 domain-containing protein [Halostella salina]|uniref:DUF7857 domain-containing protein n=1 Tax=Halostella salina TaxID=1547897 RepID=UPI000EF78BEB|nr:hypothetical protein [Halostella salina]